ncbi:hypothetical protein AA313_de0204121 [Arthrobotrys entomopaga]|nr:hypothetical protein AA313_de0204121 [Arthrobotrys entomopaga]
MAVFPTEEQQPQSSTPTATTTVTVTIPLDQPEPVAKLDGEQTTTTTTTTTAVPPRTLLRRDSMRRRDALLKGKEDNFLNNPSYTAPTAEDFSPHPLHPTRIVRYEFATLWDPSNPAKYGYATAHHIPKNSSSSSSNDEKRVPKNLKDRLKRSKGAMDLLRSLEEEVRRYAATLWGCIDEHSHSHTHSSLPTADDNNNNNDGDKMDTTEDFDTSKLQKSVVEEELKDSEDEEIVFVPRMKTIKLDDDTAAAPDGGVKLPMTTTSKGKSKGREIYIPVLGPPLEKSVFEAPQDDQGASFG